MILFVVVEKNLPKALKFMKQLVLRCFQSNKNMLFEMKAFVLRGFGYSWYLHILQWLFLPVDLESKWCLSECFWIDYSWRHKRIGKATTWGVTYRKTCVV